MRERNCFLPPKIGDRIPGHPTDREQELRHRRLRQLSYTTVVPGIYTAAQQEVEPGRLLTAPYTDVSAREAQAGLEETLKVLKLLGNSFGSEGLVATVHYGQDYDNAFWDGSQMVFGDGDRRLFERFTISPDITGHELAHGVTGEILIYQDQAGALNESMSDCFGVTVRQQMLGLKQSDPTAWLIGYGLLMPGVKGHALRDMLQPGTAYNDPQLGEDDQPDHMSKYYKTSSDNGGVHTNSGIPNRAFALAALDLGSTLNTLVIWQRALHMIRNPYCTFAEFAQATVNEAGPDALKVGKAWETVGIPTAIQSGPTPAPVPAPNWGGGGTGGASFPGSSMEVDTRIARAAGHAGMTVPQWLEHHFRHYFH